MTKFHIIVGSIDPWHWLSVLVDQSAHGEYSVFIPGTSHCADLAMSKASDPAALQQAREVCLSHLLSIFFLLFSLSACALVSVKAFMFLLVLLVFFVEAFWKRKFTY